MSDGQMVTKTQQQKMNKQARLHDELHAISFYC